MIEPSEVLSLSDFTQKSSECIARLAASGRPHVLTIEGLPKAVLLGVDAYERLVERADRFDLVDRVREGVEDARAGRTSPAAQAFRELRRRLERDARP